MRCIIMKKTGFILLLLGLMTIQPLMAWDFCFDMGCADCTEDYTPQQLRVNYSLENGLIAGIVQANDDSFGRVASGIVANGHIYFSRPRSNPAKSYVYDIDLSTFDGIATVTGTRTNLNYGYTEGIEFSIGVVKQHSLTLVQCPNE